MNATFEKFTMSWLANVADTEVPIPVTPVYNSFQEYGPTPRPGTAEKETESVAAPLEAISATT